MDGPFTVTDLESLLFNNTKEIFQW